MSGPPPNPIDELSNLTQCNFPSGTRLREAWLHVVAERLDPWFFEIRDQDINPTWSKKHKEFYEDHVQNALQEILLLISLEVQSSEPYLQSRQLLTAIRRLVQYSQLAPFTSLNGATRDLYKACIIYFNNTPIPNRLEVCRPPGPPPSGPIVPP